MTPKKLFQFGQPRRAGYVRAVRERVRGRDMVRVLWKDAAGRHAQSFDDTRKGQAEAKAFAQGVHEQVLSPAKAEISPTSIRELFEKYIVAKMDAWRPRTLELQRDRWGKFELFAGRSTPAHMITQEKLDEFKRAMVANKPRGDRDRSVNQVKICIGYVTAVFRWGVERDLIPPTKVGNYKPEFGRDAKRQVVTMAEYSADERVRLIGQLSPLDANRWRAWVLTSLIGLCGPRAESACSLEWTDIELDEPRFDAELGRVVYAGRIHWRPELDKMGTERWQPMPEPVAEAFWVAYGWSLNARYKSRWVFPSVQKRRRDRDLPWTYQAAVKMLHDAEARAGIPHIKYRAYHGFRRGIAGDIYDATGSEKAAADWIGDKSLRIVRDKYLLQREDALKKTAAMVGEARPKGKSETPSDTINPAEGVETHSHTGGKARADAHN